MNEPKKGPVRGLLDNGTQIHSWIELPKGQRLYWCGLIKGQKARSRFNIMHFYNAADLPAGHLVLKGVVYGPE